MTFETRPNGHVPQWVYLVALVAVSFASRVPQLRSPNLLLDGDECVLGLMAKHLLEGREVPIFFWGQHYGLSTIEALAGALFFGAFGVGAVPLKLAMLTLWTTGVLFLFGAWSAIVGHRRAFWISCVFVLTPAWAVWSMKARGGYLTSFTAAAALLWLVIPQRRRDSVWRWILAGALAAVVYFAQPLWLIGVLPIVAAVLVSRRRLSFAAAFVGAAAVSAAVAKVTIAPGPDAWRGPAIGNPSPWGMLQRVAEQIYVNQTGAYYLAWAVEPPGPATRTLAIVWCSLLLAVLLTQAGRIVTRRYSRWSHLLLVSTAATLIVTWLLLFARDARYLLPLSGLLVPLAGLEAGDFLDRQLISKRAVAGLTAGALVVGSISMVEFRRFSFLWTNPPNSWTEARRLQQVVNALGSRGVRHVYTMNGLLDTQLIFYSDEQVIARWASAEDRHPAYVREVDRALDSGKPVAVVGYMNTSGAPGCWDVPICTGGIDALVPNPETIFTVDNKYFVYVGATRDLLRTLHFDIR